MEKVYKVRTFVQHKATKNIFQIVKRRGGFNCHYILRHIAGEFPELAQKNDWKSGHNLDTYFTIIDSNTVRILYGR